jgi:hypothetical protein
MKTNSLIAKATDPAGPAQRITPWDKAEDKLRVDSLNLSPERITNQASTKTKVMTEILKHEETTYYSRHWGINE